MGNRIFKVDLIKFHFNDLTKFTSIMKSLTLFSITIFALTIGCDNAPAQNEGYGNHQISQAVPVQNQDINSSQNQSQPSISAPQSQNNSGDEIKMHTELSRETGQPLLYIPYPASWKINAQPSAGQKPITGPNGLSIGEFPAQAFIYTNDPYTNQMYQSYGQNVMAPIGIENVMSQQLMPMAQADGMTLISQYPLPGIAANNAAFANRIAVSGTQTIEHVIGSDWTDREGKKVFLVIHYGESRSSTLISWNYVIGMLQVQPSDFEKAKSQYIFALSNKIFNENELNAFNARLANQRKVDNDNYQQNQAIIKKGQADRAKINTETNEYIRNLNKASDEYRQHSNDVVQEQMGNHLNDVNVVVSPYDGKEYQVETGAKVYWINNEGKYYQTDDLFFDPNNYETQPGVWKKAPMKEYK